MVEIPTGQNLRKQHSLSSLPVNDSKPMMRAVVSKSPLPSNRQTFTSSMTLFGSLVMIAAVVLLATPSAGFLLHAKTMQKTTLSTNTKETTHMIEWLLPPPVFTTTTLSADSYPASDQLSSGLSASTSTGVARVLPALAHVFQPGLFEKTTRTVRAVHSPTALLLSSLKRMTVKLVRRHWWALPLLLCLVPLYTSVVWKTTPVTPDWWKLTDLGGECLGLQHHLHASCDATSFKSLLTLFLCSNVSYLMAGVYLLQKYPLLKRQRQHSPSWRSSSSSLSSSRAAAILLPAFPSLSLLPYVPSRGTWLSLWLFLAGTVSTLFHAVQAFGDYAIAEGWCYFDHGVAMAATLYYLKYCRAPQKPALLVGSVGILALALPLPSSEVYLWLHSAWHFLSAGAAVLWASQRLAVRQARLEALVTSS